MRLFQLHHVILGLDNNSWIEVLVIGGTQLMHLVLNILQQLVALLLLVLLQLGSPVSLCFFFRCGK